MNTAIQAAKTASASPAAPRRTSWGRRRAWLLAPALLLTLLNLPKPLTVDDAAYYYFARHIADDPLHPYDFQIFWYEWPQPANTVLAPPVLPYWWSLGLQLFGERPWLWKLWLLPFSVLFVHGLHALYRRFAHGMERPLVWLTVLSPLFLPSLNLMLDVPALALGLTALALFFRACGRRSLHLAILAGFVAGLAMETKYTALLVPAVMLLYAIWFGRLRLGVTAAGFAAALFAGCEGLLFLQHGQSHFAAALEQGRQTLASWIDEKANAAQALLPMLGGVTPALTLVGLTALGCRRTLLAVVGGIFALGYLLIAGIDLEFVRLSQTTWVWRPVEQGVFYASGLALAGTILAITWKLCFAQLSDRTTALEGLARFLAVWLVLELIAYFALTPFPAARRVMGLFVISTLLVGRLAAQTCTSPERLGLVRAIVLGGAALGLLFYGVDLTDAFAQKRAPEAAAQYIAEQIDGDRSTDPTIWYVGHWGFQFYAERLGMKPVVPDLSVLRSGDWLVVPEERWEQQQIIIDPDAAHEEREIAIEDALPLRTVRCFYGGYVPLEHHKGPRIRVTIYRITAPWTPLAPRPAPLE
jgi:hypothetical protein